MDESPRRIAEFRSARYFKLWDFRVSHNQLLLRSPKGPDVSEEPDYNVDLQFVGVDYVELALRLDGIHVTEAGHDAVAELGASIGHRVRRSDRLFIVESHEHRYHVIAARLAVLRTTSNIMESSLVLYWSPSEEESERYRERFLADYAFLEGMPR